MPQSSSSATLRFIDKHLYFIGFVTCLVAVAAGFFFLGRGLESSKRYAKENRRAIFISCTLLANTITEASQTPSDDATKYYLIAANRALTPTERKKFAAAVAKRRRTRGNLTIPNCTKVANNPNSVHATYVPRVTPTPTPTPGS